MIQRLILLFMCASVAGAATATNRVAAARPATNLVMKIQGKPVAKSLLKTQPDNALRVKDPDNRTRDLPIMFDNNRIKRIKEKKGSKK